MILAVFSAFDSGTISAGATTTVVASLRLSFATELVIWGVVLREAVEPLPGLASCVIFCLRALLFSVSVVKVAAADLLGALLAETVFVEFLPKAVALTTCCRAAG